MKNKLNYLLFILTVVFILLCNYFFISFPSVLDTFTYLFVNNNYLNEENIKIALQYIPFNLVIGNIDSIVFNTYLTYIGFIVFLLISYSSIKLLYGNNNKTYILYFLIFNVFLFGNYRFFLGGFLQILIYIGLILSFLLQIKYDDTKNKKFLIVNYTYLYFLTKINDFGIFLLVFNILYNLKFLIKNKKFIFASIVGLVLWGVMYYLVKTEIIFIEYPTNGKLKLLYNIFFNPFIWGPGIDYFNQIKLLFGNGIYGYIFLPLAIFSSIIYNRKGKQYLIGFILFYSFLLLLLPKAPSFNRYISYFYPYIGILFMSIIFKEKIYKNKYFLVIISLFFVYLIKIDNINNHTMQWNKDGRYGLDYNFGKEYICSNYSNKKIYGYFSASFKLGYYNGGCNINNLYSIQDDFFNGNNPVKTIIDNKIDIFYYSNLTDIMYDFDTYLFKYTDKIGMKLDNINIDSYVYRNLSNGFQGNNHKVNLYTINNLNSKISDVDIVNNGIAIDKKAKFLFLKIYIDDSNKNYYIKSSKSDEFIKINDYIPYNKRDWNYTYIVLGIDELNGENKIYFDEGVLKEAQFLYDN